MSSARSRPTRLFYYAYRGDYDAVVAMYHDQGLCPLKMVAFESGVNWTLGLPFIRTSPDHGTAYDIAGQGKANPSSMRAAIRLAKQLAQNRAKNRTAVTSALIVAAGKSTRMGRGNGQAVSDRRRTASGCPNLGPL